MRKHELPFDNNHVVKWAFRDRITGLRMSGLSGIELKELFDSIASSRPVKAAMYMREAESRKQVAKVLQTLHKEGWDTSETAYTRALLADQQQQDARIQGLTRTLVLDTFNAGGPQKGLIKSLFHGV